jgi:hypothetical protein
MIRLVQPPARVGMGGARRDNLLGLNSQSSSSLYGLLDPRRLRPRLDQPVVPVLGEVTAPGSLNLGSFNLAMIYLVCGVGVGRADRGTVGIPLPQGCTLRGTT